MIMIFKDEKSLKNYFSIPVNNLLMNMSSGLLPEKLSKEDVNLLKENLGNNWFEDLGYTENYKKPSFM